jgi:hypothetical protein
LSVSDSFAKVEGFRVTDSIVLVCAVLASLAAGVLMAYGVCLGLFRIFEMRAEHANLSAVANIAVVAQPVEV